MRRYKQQKVYYWNARLDRKVALLAGPFLTASEAEATANTVSPIFINECPEAVSATFGVMQCNAPGAGEGRYNNHLPAHLARNIAVNISLN